MTSLPDTIATLRETIADLIETVAQLRSALAIKRNFALIGHFDPQETIILSTILKWEVASREQLMQALYAGRSSDFPEENGIKVRVSNIRRKLAPHGAGIAAVYKRGYRMAPEHKSRLRALMAGPVAMMDEGTI